MTQQFAAYNIVVVIPAYNESGRIVDLLKEIPGFVRTILVVDDASSDRTAEVVTEYGESDTRVQLLRHERNQGVGGAMVTGFRRALEFGAQIVVKMDGDGQMASEDLPNLLRPLVLGQADYTKGNRFRDFRALARMPLLRRAGNTTLSFLTKAAVGYWNVFDPCNGFVAIRGEVLAQIPLRSIHRSFFFETSMLARLYLLGAVIREVPMPARYRGERSHLRIGRILLEFPGRLLKCFLRRLLLKNFIYDFNMESVFLLTGLPLFATGAVYGGWNWIRYAQQGIGAPTGTVVISAMLIILGFQLLLSAITEDIRNVPTVPLCGDALGRLVEESEAKLQRTSLLPPRRVKTIPR